jgi:hypothetical protein
MKGKASRRSRFRIKRIKLVKKGREYEGRDRKGRITRIQAQLKETVKVQRKDEGVFKSYWETLYRKGKKKK